MGRRNSLRLPSSPGNNPSANITTDGEDAMEDIGPPPGLEPPEDQLLDYWTKDGTTWVRHHVTPRTTLFDPKSTPDGPDYRKLDKLGRQL